jgi:predicted amidophosphoribosyltransferase
MTDDKEEAKCTMRILDGKCRGCGNSLSPWPNPESGLLVCESCTANSGKKIERIFALAEWAERYGIPSLGDCHGVIEQIVKEYPRPGLLACRDIMDHALKELPK